ncbi:MAG: glycosyltransferase family 4 protein [Bacteroidota bacterium]
MTNQKLKICYIGWAQSIHMQRIAKWFAQKGHEVSLITDQPAHLDNIKLYDISWTPDERPRYIRYLHLSFNIKQIRLLKSLFQIRKLIKEINPDILHLQTLYYPSCLGVFANFKPFVITPWNGDIIWSPNRTSIHKKIVKYALKRTDFITTNSSAMLENCLSLGLIENKLRMIQWTGVDLKNFRSRSKDQELIEKLKLNETNPIVLSTRSLGDIYNIDIIIKAIPMVLREIPDTKFIFTWHNGPKLKEIERLIDEMNVGDAVRLIGKVNHDEMPKYFNSADVFVSVSSCDTTPTSLLESMASGTPPVVASLKPINETIKDGWNGLVVPQKDPESTAKAIVKLLKDKTLCRLFTERNLSLVKEIADYDKEMGKMEKLYISLYENK